MIDSYGIVEVNRVQFYAVIDELKELRQATEDKPLTLTWLEFDEESLYAEPVGTYDEHIHHDEIDRIINVLERILSCECITIGHDEEATFEEEKEE